MILREKKITQQTHIVEGLAEAITARVTSRPDVDGLTVPRVGSRLFIAEFLGRKNNFRRFFSNWKQAALVRFLENPKFIFRVASLALSQAYRVEVTGHKTNECISFSGSKSLLSEETLVIMPCPDAYSSCRRWIKSSLLVTVVTLLRKRKEKPREKRPLKTFEGKL